MRRLAAIIVLFSVAILLASLPATDNFNRANEIPITGNWTNELNTANLVANAVTCAAVGDFCGVRWNADSFPADQYAQVLMTNIAGGSNYMGPTARMATGAATFYLCMSPADAGGTTYLTRFVAGSSTDLATGSGAPDGSTFRITVRGTGATVTITCAADSGSGFVTLASASDTDASRITSGSAGFGGKNVGTNVIDNWQGGSLATTPIVHRVTQN